MTSPRRGSEAFSGPADETPRRHAQTSPMQRPLYPSLHNPILWSQYRNYDAIRQAYLFVPLSRACQCEVLPPMLKQHVEGLSEERLAQPRSRRPIMTPTTRPRSTVRSTSSRTWRPKADKCGADYSLPLEKCSGCRVHSLWRGGEPSDDWIDPVEQGAVTEMASGSLRILVGN